MMIESFFDYWIMFCFAALGAMVTGIYKRFKRKFLEHIKEHDVLQDGVKALLQDRLVQAHDHYCEQGYCKAHSLKNLHNMYQQYKRLGGNGAMDELMEDVNDLPHQIPRGGV